MSGVGDPLGESTGLSPPPDDQTSGQTSANSLSSCDRVVRGLVVEITLLVSLLRLDPQNGGFAVGSMLNQAKGGILKKTHPLLRFPSHD